MDYHAATTALYHKTPAVKSNIQTPERIEQLNFTEPYIELPNAMIVRNEINASLHLGALKNMTVSVVKNHAIQEYIRTNYPDFKLNLVPDPLPGLQKVSFGQLDIMILNLAIASHYFEAESLTNLSMAGESNRLSTEMKPTMSGSFFNFLFYAYFCSGIQGLG